MDSDGAIGQRRKETSRSGGVRFCLLLAVLFLAGSTLPAVDPPPGDLVPGLLAD